MSLIYQTHFTAPPHGRRSWVRPVNLVSWGAAVCDRRYHRLAGGWMGFCDVDVVQRTDQGFVASRMSVDDWLASASDKPSAQATLARLTQTRADFASLTMAEPQIMGIVNATPDSFSDGGLHFAADDGIAAAMAMAEQGATILDVGGESTRPGAEAVAHSEEIRRIVPIIAALQASGLITSADTRHKVVMQKALETGAPIINDVGGFRDDGAAELMGKWASAKTGFAIAMHMQGTPETMQKNPHYDFAPIDVYEWLEARIAVLESAGVPRSHIAVDPGFGFGKTPQHNLELIQWTSLFHGLGVPVLIGVSRKSSIAKLSKDEPATERLGGSLALTLSAIDQGAQMIRTHDVAQTAQAIHIHRQMRSAG